MKIQVWVRDRAIIEGWRQAAELEGMTLSAWLRRAAERARSAESGARSLLAWCEDRPDSGQCSDP